MYVDKFILKFLFHLSRYLNHTHTKKVLAIVLQEAPMG